MQVRLTNCAEDNSGLLHVSLLSDAISDILSIVASKQKLVIWLHGEVKTPPFSKAARVEVGYLLRLVQRGDKLCLPVSRPMPSIGPGCHELRLTDENREWRVIYHIGADEIHILDVFAKTTNQTPKAIIKACERRLKRYLKVP